MSALACGEISMISHARKMQRDMAIPQHDGNCVDDMGQSLSSIVALSGTSITDQLLSIQKHRFKEHESTSFVKELVCFSHEPQSSSDSQCKDGKGQPNYGHLSRHIIDGRTQRDYVALSYTWNPSEREGSSSGGYTVEQPESSQSQQLASPVRDCALTRAVRYMQHAKVGYLWIDRHSVDQDDEQKKQRGVQAMHLVYSYSNHPVALLARTVYSHTELERLHRLLAGKVVRRVTARVVKQHRISLKLAKGITRVEALETIRLLYAMSRDDWWTRAWTFQENYRAGVRMTLLIPHSTILESEKRRFGVFGTLPGELSIKAVALSDHATRLCQVLKSGVVGTLSQETKTMIKNILKTMGKYTRILDRSQLMTPKIISDISNRGIKDSWDRLAITANCCWFPTRLDTLGLKREGHSLSLSVLALFLLNGGILDNGSRTSPHEALYYTTPQYLKFQSFNRFRSPYQAHPLTFNKNCRFHNVRLVDDGIKTNGHLWKLGSLIDSSVLHDIPIAPEAKSFRLNEEQRQSLRQLELSLKQQGMRTLASSIGWLLELDGNTVQEEDWKLLPFKEQYLLQMALELAYSIKKGGKLRVGALWDSQTSTPSPSEQRALFVWNEDSDGPKDTQDEITIPPTFAFTSIVPVGAGDGEYRKDVNRHVSLEVEMECLDTSEPDTYVPRLYIKNWLLGVCFVEDAVPSDVIFPWPTEFQ
ncbi:unnamed protein product [Clonostachys rosea]|uniref:Heterokaryon incompatibility domain-containing protein n=1 Tax=Bionectria ochroleuca TaxID=29856 RepID=A0ABY6URW6_BIOOC|nr:unnamed protein product [Clonostachys rosea]